MLNGGVLLGSQLGGSEPSNDGFSYARYWDGSSFSWTKTPTFSSVTIDEGGTSSLVITETGDAGIVFQAPGPQEVLGLRAYGDGTVNIGASIGNFSITSEDQLTLQSGTIDDILFVAGGSTRGRFTDTGEFCVGIGSTGAGVAHFRVGSGTAGSWVSTAAATALVEQVGDWSQLGLKSPPNKGQFILGIDDVFEMYAGWYGSTHANAQRWEMVAADYQFYDTAYAKTIVFDSNMNIIVTNTAPFFRLTDSDTGRATAYAVIEAKDNAGLSIFDIAALGDGDVQLRAFDSSADLVFKAGGDTERMRIDSTGDVLLASGAQLFWGANTDSYIQSFTSTGAIYYDSISGTQPYHRFRTDSTDKFFIYPTYLETRIPLLIKEAAAGVASVATYGQLWVKNTTPCELWFTDDAGTSTKIV